jgi:hypothetical protein
MPPGEQELKTDIQKILSEVKLPERHETKLTGEAKQGAEVKPIDALLSGTAQGATEPSQAVLAEPPKPQDMKVVSVHTLKDDLQGVVRDQKISVVRAAALEEEKRGGAPEPLPTPQSHRLRSTLIIVGFLALLGLAALGGVYYVAGQKAAPVSASPTDSLVFAESSVAFPLQSGTPPQALKAQLATARQKSGSLGSITRIVPVVSTTSADGTTAQQAATFSEFMSAIGAHPPDELVRALSDKFFLGIHTVDKNAPLIIVPVTSYEHAFNGMLTWEMTLNSDLAPLFTLVSQYTSQNGIPTVRAFTDSVFRNYDVRQLTDDSGQIVLYYSFPTRNILIIAESPYTFTEVLTRLQAQRAL